MKSSGKSFSSMRSGKNKNRDFNTTIINLECSREHLYTRINNRVEEMLEKGLESEVYNLRQFKDLNTMNTVGYKEFIEINAFLTGSVSIGLISGAYTTEVLRGAIESINKGQFDGAKSLGLKKTTYYVFVIAPQVLRLSLPNLSNVWQLTLKDTALISVTGLVEIMRQSSVAARSTHSPFTFYLAAAVLYLCLTTFSTIIFDKIEVKSKKNEATI